MCCLSSGLFLPDNNFGGALRRRHDVGLWSNSLLTVPCGDGLLWDGNRPSGHCLLGRSQLRGGGYELHRGSRWIVRALPRLGIYGVPGRLLHGGSWQCCLPALDSHTASTWLWDGQYGSCDLRRW